MPTDKRKKSRKHKHRRHGQQKNNRDSTNNKIQEKDDQPSSKSRPTPPSTNIPSSNDTSTGKSTPTYTVIKIDGIKYCVTCERNGNSDGYLTDNDTQQFVQDVNFRLNMLGLPMFHQSAQMKIDCDKYIDKIKRTWNFPQEEYDRAAALFCAEYRGKWSIIRGTSEDRKMLLRVIQKARADVAAVEISAGQNMDVITPLDLTSDKKGSKWQSGFAEGSELGSGFLMSSSSGLGIFEKPVTSTHETLPTTGVDAWLSHADTAYQIGSADPATDRQSEQQAGPWITYLNVDPPLDSASAFGSNSLGDEPQQDVRTVPIQMWSPLFSNRSVQTTQFGDTTSQLIRAWGPEVGPEFWKLRNGRASAQSNNASSKTTFRDANTRMSQNHVVELGSSPIPKHMENGLLSIAVLSEEIRTLNRLLLLDEVSPGTPELQLNCITIDCVIGIYNKLPHVYVVPSCYLHGPAKGHSMDQDEIDRMFQNCWDGLQRRWKRDKRAPTILLVPCQSDGHWTLHCINLEAQTIYHYDSLPGVGRQADVIRSFLDHAYPEYQHKWNRVSTICAQQIDDTSCGLFTILNAEAILAGMLPNQEKVPMFSSTPSNLRIRYASIFLESANINSDDKARYTAKIRALKSEDGQQATIESITNTSHIAVDILNRETFIASLNSEKNSMTSRLRVQIQEFVSSFEVSPYPCISRNSFQVANAENSKIEVQSPGTKVQTEVEARSYISDDGVRILPDASRTIPVTRRSKRINKDASKRNGLAKKPKLEDLQDVISSSALPNLEPLPSLGHGTLLPKRVEYWMNERTIDLAYAIMRTSPGGKSISTSVIKSRADESLKDLETLTKMKYTKRGCVYFDRMASSEALPSMGNLSSRLKLDNCRNRFVKAMWTLSVGATVIWVIKGIEGISVNGRYWCDAYHAYSHLRIMVIVDEQLDRRVQGPEYWIATPTSKYLMFPLKAIADEIQCMTTEWPEARIFLECLDGSASIRSGLPKAIGHGRNGDREKQARLYTLQKTLGVLRCQLCEGFAAINTDANVIELLNHILSRHPEKCQGLIACYLPGCVSCFSMTNSRARHCKKHTKNAGLLSIMNNATCQIWEGQMSKKDHEKFLYKCPCNTCSSRHKYFSAEIALVYHVASLHPNYLSAAIIEFAPWLSKDSRDTKDVNIVREIEELELSEEDTNSEIALAAVAQSQQITDAATCGKEEDEDDGSLSDFT